MAKFISVRCSKCQAKLKLNSKATGKKATCPKCGHAFVVKRSAKTKPSTSSPQQSEEDFLGDLDPFDESLAPSTGGAGQSALPPVKRRRSSKGGKARTKSEAASPSGGGQWWGLGSLILGILAFFVCWIPLIGFVFSGLGLVLGVVGLIIAKTRKAPGLGYAIGGSAISAIAMIPSIVWIMFVASSVEVARQMSEEMEQQIAEQEQRIAEQMEAEAQAGPLSDEAGVHAGPSGPASTASAQAGPTSRTSEPTPKSGPSKVTATADHRGARATSAELELPATFTAPDQAERLSPASPPDGPFTTTIVSGKPALQGASHYLYFRVDDAFAHDLPADTDEQFTVRVTVFDAQEGSIDLQYDGHPESTGESSTAPYVTTPASHKLTGSGRWLELDFELPRPRFAGNQNSRADFRLRRANDVPLVVHKVALTRKKRREQQPPMNAGRSAGGAEEETLRTGVVVTYFRGIDFKNKIRSEILTRPIQFFWNKSPGTGIPEDGWSAQYEGYLVVEESDVYEFHTTSDDGSRVYINDKQVVDNWGKHGPQRRSGKIRLASGRHGLRIDYFDDQYGAHMKFHYTDPNRGRIVPVPVSMLRYNPKDVPEAELAKSASPRPSSKQSRDESPVIELDAPAPPLSLGRVVKLQEPRNHGGFQAFVFSPDGQIVAGGSGAVTATFGRRTTKAGGEVLLWNANTGRLTKTLGGHGETVRWLQFSSDGKTLVSTSRANGVVKVWQMPAGRLRHTLKAAPQGEINNLDWPLRALSPDGRFFAGVTAKIIPLGESKLTQGGELIVWDLDSGQKAWSLDDSELRAVTFTPDGKSLAGVTRKIIDPQPTKSGGVRYNTEYQLRFWNAADGEVTRSIDQERSRSPKGLAFLDAGQTLGVLTNSGLFQLDPQTGAVEKEFRWHKDRWAFNAFAFSPDGNTLGRAWTNWGLELVDLAEGRPKGLLSTEFPKHLWHVAFSPNLERVACTLEHNPVVVHLAGGAESR